MDTNVLVPLPLPAHIIFCIVGTLYFGFRYYQKNYLYYLLLAVAIPSTLLIYMSNERWYFIALAIEEFILAVMIFVNMRKVEKQKKTEEKAAETVPEEPDNPPADSHEPANYTVDDILADVDSSKSEGGNE